MASHIMNVFYILTTVITFFRRLRPRHFLQTSFPPLPRNSVRENSLQSLQVCPTLVLLLDGVSVALVEVDCGVDLVAVVAICISSPFCAAVANSMRPLAFPSFVLSLLGADACIIEEAKTLRNAASQDAVLHVPSSASQSKQPVVSSK